MNFLNGLIRKEVFLRGLLKEEGIYFYWSKNTNSLYDSIKDIRLADKCHDGDVLVIHHYFAGILFKRETFVLRKSLRDFPLNVKSSRVDILNYLVLPLAKGVEVASIRYET